MSDTPSHIIIAPGEELLCGMTIGERAIVGVGSVMTRGGPPDTVVAGNPAKVLRRVDEVL